MNAIRSVFVVGILVLMCAVVILGNPYRNFEPEIKELQDQIDSLKFDLEMTDSNLSDLEWRFENPGQPLPRPRLPSRL